MINLFSSFDSSTIYFSLNWLRNFYRLLFIPLVYWFIPSKWIIIYFFLIKFICQEFKTINNNFKFINLIFITIIFYILLNNFLGLFPYLFTRTSHLIFPLRLALPLWLRYIIFGWISNYTHILSHLIPRSTPFLLIPFITCIEIIRNIIRPGTLSIRLTANIISGHLILILISRLNSNLPLYIIIVIIIIQAIFLILEIRVALIQSYVFSTLNLLYSKEIS